MYGDPALPPDFVSLPYTNPEAPKGGEVVFGNTGGFDSLNPFAPKGTSPWQLRFLGYESLMGRSWDEAFTLYGLLAESIEVPDDRSWVEFTLRPEAKFSDNSPVTVEDVIWSYETLGTQGHLRYRSFWSKVQEIRQTGPRSLRISFNTPDRELALIAGLRPILKKSQWQEKEFAHSTLREIPIGSGPYIIENFDAGRFVALKRNTEYWGENLPIRKGTQNFDKIRLEFFGDQTVLFEAFKAGVLTAYREFNAAKWESAYGFPAVLQGKITKSEIPNQRPTGISGLAFKVSAVPFHMWTPDVYQGAPTPVTAFFASAPKMAAMGLFARVMHDAFGHAIGDWSQIIAVLSLLSMFVGAVAAIGQRDIKRLMAYSSIAHMGYALMGLAAGTDMGVEAMLVYMAIYVAMNIGTFAFILMLQKDGQPVTSIDALHLYSRREPGKALAMLVLLFSLAGVPPMLGFFGKLYVLRAAYEAGLAWLAIAGVVASVIGAFYYLRIVYYMYFGEEGEDLDRSTSPVLWVFLMGSAAVMVFGIINMFGVDSAAAAAAAALVH